MRFFLCLLACVSAKTLWHQLEGYTFENYIAEYEKSYVSDYAYRQGLFEKKLIEIKQHNAGDSTYKKGINKFSDLTQEEFRSRWTGYNRMSSKAPVADLSHMKVSDVPNDIDWRTKGVVTKVKNQGGCGSCWAFAAVEQMESAVAIATGSLLTLSEQNVVSCTKNPKHCGGTGGCQGATAELGMDYVAQMGISDEKTYPYRAVTGTCKETTKAAHVGGFHKLKENDHDDLLKAVGSVGPIAISVCADFGDFENGIFDGCKAGCVIDHGVVAVGYGTSGGTDYWLVRNSWGSSWGAGGYINLKRFGDSTSHCGTDTRAADGTACDGDPSSVKICGMCGILYDTCYATNATKA